MLLFNIRASIIKSSPPSLDDADSAGRAGAVTSFANADKAEQEPRCHQPRPTPSASPLPGHSLPLESDAPIRASISAHSPMSPPLAQAK